MRRYGNAGRDTIALAATLVVIALVAGTAGWAAPNGKKATPSGPPPLSTTMPSIVAGEAGYASACAACHPASIRFRTASWRSAYTPAEVAGISMGRMLDHPAAENDLTKAWDVTAYVWTLPDTRADIRHGESLAFEAQKRLQAEAVRVALLHWHDLQDLRSASWVLTHTPDQVRKLMATVAGSTYTNLSPGDQQDLIAYTFASYFDWPPSWR